MGDYGTKGAAEFGGQDGNFACLPDYHFTKCPHREQGLGGDYDREFWCKLTEGPDADGRGFGYDKCKCLPDDYRECPIWKRNLEKISKGGKTS